MLDASRVTASTSLAGRLLLVAQIALSLVLLVAAGVFSQTMTRLHANDAGFEPSRVIWARLWPNPGDRTAAFGAQYWIDIAQQMARMPGVESVGYANSFPAVFAAPPAVEGFTVADATAAGPVEVDGVLDVISPGFFRTIGIPVLEGRDVAWTDKENTQPVAVVSAALALRLFPGRTAIGRRVRLRRDPAQAIEIVGIVADATVADLRNPRPAALFRPMLQDPRRQRAPIALVRGRGDVRAARDAYLQAATSGGRHFVRSIYRLDDYVDEALLRERLIAGLSSFFAALAVLLSTIGIYALLAYSVARRAREIGLRMALGARPRSVLQSVAREGLMIGGAGIAVGIPSAVLAGRFARSIAYGLAPNDPLTIVSASIAFATVTGLAGLVPAYRASTIEPMTALRQE